MDVSFFFKALILGVVQGLTEFLPVSSSGHLAIGEYFLDFHAPGVTFEVALHIGTLMAVFVFFRKEILSLIQSFLIWGKSLAGKKTILDDAGNDRLRRDLALIAAIIVGSIPTGLMGVLFKDWFESFFGGIQFIAAFLIVTAILLTAGDYISRRRDALGKKTSEVPSILSSLVIGFFQGVAIMPGISRSGATVSAALAMGLDRENAARFSFLLGIPAMLGAAVLTAKDAAAIPLPQLPGYAIGVTASAIVGYFAISTFIKIVKQGRIIWFAVYCAVIGTGLLIYLNIK